MPEVKSIANTQIAMVTDDVSVRETRFDPPHEIARGDAEIRAIEPSSDTTSASGAEAELPRETFNVAALDFALAQGDDVLAPEVIQQFRLQATQLAAHLEARQRDMDRREAELNASYAKQESAARNARLWFQERNHDLEERRTELDNQEQQLREQLDSAANQVTETSEEIAIAGSIGPAEMDARGIHLHDEGDRSLQDFALERRRMAIEQLEGEIHLREEQCDRHEERLSIREERLEATEALVARRQVELEDDRTALNQAQEKLAAEARRREVEAKKQTEKLAARAQFLDRRSASLDQLRSEVLRMQRESLEMRLITEELWGQISGAAPPAAVTQSLARLRTKLADHYHLQTSDIATQRKELEELAATMSQQHARIAAQKRELNEWVRLQQNEIESQAARLVAREAELDREQNARERERLEWEADRRNLENENRRLETRVRRAETESMTVD